MFALVVILAGCSTTVARKAQHTEGLIAFLGALGRESDEVVIPIECVAGREGYIVTANVSTSEHGLVVHGLVRRMSFSDPAFGAHVDVLLLNARGKIIESVATSYWPQQIPHGSRNAFPQSRYSVPLITKTPPSGATLKVVFHDESKSSCLVALGF